MRHPPYRNSLRLALAGLTILSSACREKPHAANDNQDIVSTAGSLVTPASAETRTPSRGADPTTSRRTAIVEAADRVSPAVVSITVTSRQAAQQNAWDYFFVPQETEQEVMSYGTGFVIRSEGIILTNQHVVAGAEKIVVTLRDGTDVPARLLGEDAISDIAVLKIDRRNVPTVALGRSTDLMVGEWVIALGNPFAYLLGNAEPTVTAGVISATGRNILPGNDQTGQYLDMIQTDAAINPGNSGGPLTNALGEVVGVNSSILTQSGGSVGLGFAIPIERALHVSDEIIRNGTVRRAWIGLDVAGAQSMQDWKTQGGVLITGVAPGGPADRAGLHRGDVLTQANGRRLRNYLDWEAVKLDLHVGDSVQVTGRQGSRTVNRLLVSGDLPTTSAEKVTVLKDLQLVTLTPQVQAERGTRSDRGALIFRIARATSESTGLREGDVIVALNRQPVRDAAQVREFINGMTSRQPVRVYIERQGQISYTDLMFR
ncbi:MAG: trypsin-like peptidase domain-containing protein [Gemmatimonadota bacterium]